MCLRIRNLYNESDIDESVQTMLDFYGSDSESEQRLFFSDHRAEMYCVVAIDGDGTKSGGVDRVGVECVDAPGYGFVGAVELLAVDLGAVEDADNSFAERVAFYGLGFHHYGFGVSLLCEAFEDQVDLILDRDFLDY